MINNTKIQQEEHSLLYLEAVDANSAGDLGLWNRGGNMEEL